MLGHFSAGFTLDTYAHVTTAAQKEAAETMGNILQIETLNHSFPHVLIANGGMQILRL
jgi:hypothetical protein